LLANKIFVVLHFVVPPDPAAKVALTTVRDWLQNNDNSMDMVVFDIWEDRDLKIYQNLIPTIFPSSK